MLIQLRRRFRQSYFYELFNSHTDGGKGRICVLCSSILSLAFSSLTSGVFYTGFLLANDINIVEIGTIGYIPFLANIIGMLSPIILERIKKRKLVLCMARLFYVTFNIGAVTLTPYLGLSKDAKITVFILCVFVANLINALFTPGFNVWHLQFLPSHIRANFFAFQQIVNALVGWSIVLVSSIIADYFTTDANKLTVIVIVRCAAYALALLDVLILSRPKESPYETNKGEVTLKNILILPFKHGKFIATMLIVLAWNFSNYLTISPFNVYLLNDVGIKYTLITGLNFIFSIFLILLAPVWKKFIRKRGWLQTVAFCMLMHMPAYLLMSFVTASNYLWLYTFLRLWQHFVGVGFNISWANIAYINLPQSNQTNYIAFFIMTTNLGAFLGQLTGTKIVKYAADISVHFLGTDFTVVQMLFWLQAAIIIATALITMKNMKFLAPLDDKS